MSPTSLKRLLDACFVSKRVIETLPELPEKMKPRHIHVLDAIHETQLSQGICRVSDVSARLNITRPSITKLVQELEALGLLEKYADKEDKRVTLLCLTDRGMECVKRHVVDFHTEWAEALKDVTDEQVQETITIIERLYETMPGKKE